MPPPEIIPVIAIISIFVLLPAIITLGILTSQRQKRTLGNGNSIGMRELESIVQRAVEQATEPLREQMDRLEDRIDAIQEPNLLQDTGIRENRLRIEDPEVREKTVGRSSRLQTR